MPNPYEKKNIQDIIKRNKQIEKILAKANKDISKRFTTVKGKRFAKVMQKEISVLRTNIKNNIDKGIKHHWKLGNAKGDKFTDGYLQNIKISDQLYKSFRSPNLTQLNTFLGRTQGGMNLSKRVWNLTDTYKTQLEEYLASGVTSGKSAIQVSKEMNRFMDGKGIQYKGVLIKGVNVTFQAIRLATTEINMAYRMAEELKMQRLPFVTGCEIHLSDAHPTTDICDDLRGEYTKDFVWGGWHPLCICYRTWKTLDRKDFVGFMKTGDIAKRKFITKMPPNMKQFMTKHGDKIKGYKTKPYWVKDNFTAGLQPKTMLGEVVMPEIAPKVPIMNRGIEGLSPSSYGQKDFKGINIVSWGKDRTKALRNAKDIDLALSKAPLKDIQGLNALYVTDGEFLGSALYTPPHVLHGYGGADEIMLQMGWQIKNQAGRIRTLLHEVGHRAQFLTRKETFKAFKREGLGEYFKDVTDIKYIKNYPKSQYAGETFAESYSRHILGIKQPEALTEFWKNRGLTK